MTWVITSQTRFYLHEDETLLEGLIRTGHKIEYQCKEGYCGSCRVKLLAQSEPVTYPFEPLAMLDENEILPCCCEVEGTIHIKTSSQAKNK